MKALTNIEVAERISDLSEKLCDEDDGWKCPLEFNGKEYNPQFATPLENGKIELELYPLFDYDGYMEFGCEIISLEQAFTVLVQLQDLYLKLLRKWSKR